MREASPGDLVLSYANGKIGRIGVVGDFAISAPKPSEFGSIGSYWQDAGWLLPVQWLEQQISVQPKAIIGRLAGVLPQTHSPIRAATGAGNQKAYLAEVDRAVFEIVFAAVGLAVGDFEIETPTITIADFAAQFDDAVEAQIRADQDLDQTTRDQLTRARRGQGLFRRRVLSKEPACRVTGVRTPTLLIASHVKPWRACETAAERLDGFNGLMLTPHADFLFDRGLIGFANDGTTLFSSRLTEADGIKLGLHHSQRPPAKPLHDASLGYFEHHRSKVFMA
ncbi:HNH endonuclease [Sphingomonas sabuli]|uniref:HNH endonuclease n=2 Tax=Sphingomonas sabuli TaxID=2764186 RepID=A0A7G9L638_9SPHN|nr:HNH endonuclease [Sphingomonas sabuli]